MLCITDSFTMGEIWSSFSVGILEEGLRGGGFAEAQGLVWIGGVQLGDWHISFLDERGCCRRRRRRRRRQAGGRETELDARRRCQWWILLPPSGVVWQGDARRPSPSARHARLAQSRWAAKATDWRSGCFPFHGGPLETAPAQFLTAYSLQPAACNHSLQPGCSPHPVAHSPRSPLLQAGG